MTDHRSDPRTMEARWRAMGYEVAWSDAVRAYLVMPSAALAADEACYTMTCRTVDEVEAFVVAHGEGGA